MATEEDGHIHGVRWKVNFQHFSLCFFLYFLMLRLPALGEMRYQWGLLLCSWGMAVVAHSHPYLRKIAILKPPTRLFGHLAIWTMKWIDMGVIHLLMNNRCIKNSISTELIHVKTKKRHLAIVQHSNRTWTISRCMRGGFPSGLSDRIKKFLPFRRFGPKFGGSWSSWFRRTIAWGAQAVCLQKVHKRSLFHKEV